MGEDSHSKRVQPTGLAPHVLAFAVRNGSPIRHPAIVIALALGCGIVCDRLLPARLEVWLLAAVPAIPAWMWLACFRFARVSAAVLLLGVVCRGAARHVFYWWAAAGNDLSLFASDEPRVVRVTGTLLDRPDVISREAGNKRSAWPHPDASSAT